MLEAFIVVAAVVLGPLAVYLLISTEPPRRPPARPIPEPADSIDLDGAIGDGWRR